MKTRGLPCILNRKKHKHVKKQKKTIRKDVNNINKNLCFNRQSSYFIYSHAMAQNPGLVSDMLTFISNIFPHPHLFHDDCANYLQVCYLTTMSMC